jgi:ribonuclease HI
MDELITLQFDGGSRGNPGPAGIGVVLRAADGTPLVTLGRYIGHATNNAAEYQALIVALEQAKRLGARHVLIRGDSELIVKQMRGEYRVRHPDLRPLHQRANQLLREFATARIEHNLRCHNALADKLANLAMDRKGDVDDVIESGTGVAKPDELDAPSPVAPKAGTKYVCPRCGCSIEISKPSPVRPHQLKPFICQCGNPMHD